MDENEITVVVGNYSASNANSYLAYLEKLSAERGDRGLLHGGHIHYIQHTTGGILKAAIAAVLDNVPGIFPLDLPEQVKANPDLPMTDIQRTTLQKINDGLIMPIGGGDLLDIISAAREYAVGKKRL